MNTMTNAGTATAVDGAVAVDAPMFAGKTAEEWRARALKSRRDSYESFERCDTDGFLSQWASDQMASRYIDLARVAEDGGVLTRVALFRDGVHLSQARFVQTRFGWAWVFDDENGETVWVNESKARDAMKRRAAMLKKGFTLGWIRQTAALNSREMRAYPDPEGEVVVLTSDDTDFRDGRNNPY